MIQRKNKSLLGERRGSDVSPRGLRSGVVKALKAEEGEALFPRRLESQRVGWIEGKSHRKPLWGRSGALAWMCFSRAVGPWR